MNYVTQHCFWTVSSASMITGLYDWSLHCDLADANGPHRCRTFQSPKLTCSIASFEGKGQPHDLRVLTECFRKLVIQIIIVLINL